MIRFNTTILKFGEKGEKSGWTYIGISAAQAQKLKPGSKKPFRVKGKLDQYAIKGVALWAMGEGNFILPLNAAIRKGIGKRKGESIAVAIEEDKEPKYVSSDLMECLANEPAALEFYNTLPPSQKNYFISWIESAKAENTKVGRISQAINALLKGQNYVLMIRSLKGTKP